MNKTIAVLPGDGIGQEVMPQAINILKAIARKFHLSFTFLIGDIGGTAFEKYDEHFPLETKIICQRADAILFGSVGDPISQAHLPKWHHCETNSILALRKTFQFNVNFRPIRIYPELCDLSPLKISHLAKKINCLIVRELIGDIYFGEHKQWQSNNFRYASDVAEYNELQIKAVAQTAFQLAKQRRKKLTSIDKANVLETSKLWREIVSEVALEYPEVTLDHVLVDNCAMQLIINPVQFDVILTPNLFGDILSDEASALIGSLGLSPSASLNTNGFGLYEPSGGSAPDIAGKNLANPIAQILSAAMLLRYSFNLESAALCIENAVQQALINGFRTKDIYTEGNQLVGTQEMGDRILSYI